MGSEFGDGDETGHRRGRLVLFITITLYACARGKAIGSIVIVVIVADTKIAKSGDLGT